jgi:hypothetical protein
MITISDTVVRVVVDITAMGIDPLGIGPDPLDRSVRARGLVEDALDGMDQATARRVADALVADLADRRRTIGNPSGLVPMDPLCARMLHHLDIDPLAAAWLGVVIGTVDLDDENGVLVARTDGGVPPWEDAGRASAAAGNGAFWLQTGRLDVPALPDTISGLCRGRALRDVVSHPVLDGHPLRIVDVEHWDGVDTLVTDHRARPATIDELIALGPCGCR